MQAPLRRGIFSSGEGNSGGVTIGSVLWNNAAEAEKVLCWRKIRIHQRKEEEMGPLTKQGEHLKGKWGSKDERKLRNENVLDRRKAKKDRRHAQEPRIMAPEWEDLEKNVCPPNLSIRKVAAPWELCNQKGWILYILETQEINTLRYENESPPGNKVVRFEELMKMGATPRTQWLEKAVNSFICATANLYLQTSGFGSHFQ